VLNVGNNTIIYWSAGQHTTGQIHGQAK